MLSKLEGSEKVEAGVVGAGLKGTGLTTALAASAKPGMVIEMLLARLSMEGGAVGSGCAEWAELLMPAATPARDGMLVAMMSVIPLRVGASICVDPSGEERGGASLSEGEETVMSSVFSCLIG